MQFADKSVIAGTQKRESDGALVADVRIARTGVQYYLGREVDPEDEHGFRDAKVVAVYRPGEEVFSDSTMRSAAHRPVTNDHPPEGLVTSDNWKKRAVGNTADEVVGQGIYIRVPLIVSDAAAISDIETGKREVSAGYTSELDWTSGVTPSGEHYDAVQRNIRINHVAIVQRGRAGKEVRIGDEAAAGIVLPVEDSGVEERTYTMNHPLKTVTVDGIPVEVTDAGAQVIATLQARIQKMTDASVQVQTDHAKALADKDSEIAKKDAEIEKLKGQILDAAGIDKLVSERAQLISDAKAIYKDGDFTGKTPVEIRKMVVVHKLGDAAIQGKSEAYVDARFDTLVEDAKKLGTGDTFRDALRQTPPTTPTTTGDRETQARAAYDEMVKELVSPKIPNAEKVA